MRNSYLQLKNFLWKSESTTSVMRLDMTTLLMFRSCQVDIRFKFAGWRISRTWHKLYQLPEPISHGKVDRDASRETPPLRTTMSIFRYLLVFHHKPQPQFALFTTIPFWLWSEKISYKIINKISFHLASVP